ALELDPALPLERLLGVLGGLFYSGRHFVRLAVAVGHPAILVADDDQGVEAETPAALDHGGAAADLDHAFLKSVLPAFSFSRHSNSPARLRVSGFALAVNR